MRRRARGWVLVGLVVVGGPALAACGDDGGGGDGDVEAYCRLNDELNAAEGLPSDEQLDEIVAAAPGEIREAAATVADLVREQEGDVFSAEIPEEVQAAIGELEAFEAENCATGDG